MVGLSVAGEKICCFIPEGKNSQEVQILNSIRFAAQPGKLMAIMGPSGSGKTTLVNILAGRTVAKLGQQDVAVRRKGKPRMVITGSLYLNGNAVSSDEMALSSRYVMQTDRLFEYLTVAETLTFAAKLKLRGCSRAEVKGRVEHVIDEMGLHSCRDVLIGGQISKGVSGGQKKRVAVAIELLDNPELLFLDEPTSGLDSSLAFDVVEVLKGMTKKGGRTVIATIHQPRSQIYKMFDTLLLLSRGEVVFHGPASEAGIFAREIGLVVPSNFNITDFLLDVLSVGTAKTELTDELIRRDTRSFTKIGSDSLPEEVLQLENLDPPLTRAFISDEELQKLPDKFGKTKWAENLASQIDEIIANPRLIPIVASKSARNHTIHYCKTIKTLMHRHLINKLRDPGSTAVRLSVTAVMALINGLIYFRIEFPTHPFDCRRFYNVLGALAFVCFSLSFGSLDIIIHFPETRPQYNREVASRMYRPSAFYIAQCLGDIPFLAMGAILVTLIVYWMVGYDQIGGNVGFFMFAAIVNAFAAVGWATIGAMFSPNAQVVGIIAPIGTIFAVLTGGFWITEDALGPFWRLFRWVSWIRYSINALNEHLFADLGILPNCQGVSGTTGPWTHLGAAIGLGVGFRLIGYFGLKYTHTRLGLDA